MVINLLNSIQPLKPSFRRMWCSLNEVKRAGNAAGFQEAREFLYRSATAPTSKSIDEEVVEEAELMNNGKSVDWLQDCYWLCSPAMELIVLLRLDKAVVINCSPALTTAGGDLTIKEKFTFDHNVVAATILPIVGGSRKSESRPFDWCCLVVGYECGQLEFYSISPQIKRVYHIRYSAAPIRSIRTSSPQAELQELAVLYSDCLVVIDGLSLLTTLKACRSQIAFQQVASKEDLSAVADLVFKKWKIAQDDVLDFICAGVVQSSVLNQMEAASMAGGFGSSMRPEMPLHVCYVCVGNGPTVGVFWAEDESESLRISDMVSNFAGNLIPNSVKSFTGKLAGWTFGSGSTTKKINPENVKPLEMKYRSGIVDSSRVCYSLSLAPNRKYLALTDDLARVSLFDVNSRSVLRIWKGYREAQCGWICSKGDLRSPDSSATKSNRSVMVLFLVIFAPKRGILEIWTAQNGPRVGAFTVDKRGRLITTSSFILGLPALPTNDSCSFLDSNGKLYKIEVPFQAALQDESSSHLHDSNLLREYKMLIHNYVETPGQPEEERLTQTLNEFKTIDLLSSALERTMLQSQMSPKVLSILTDTAEQRAETLKTSQSAGISYRRLIARCHCYSQLLNIFAFLLAQKDSGDEIVVEDTLRDRESDVADLLQLEMSELTRLLVDTEMNLTAKPKAKASGNDQLLNVSQFIRLFDISRIIASMNMAEADSDSNQNFDRENMPFSKLFLKNDLTNHEKQLLGEFIFKPFMTGADLNSLPAQLKAQLTLEEEEIFQLFCHAWLDKQHNYSVYPQKLYFLILQMVESFSPQANSKWLQTLESAIIDCSNLAEALMLAIIVRPVSSISHKSKMEVEEEFGSGAESFEQLKPSLERWDSLLKHLHLLLILETLLYQEPIITEHQYDWKVPKVSLREFLNSGKAFVQEMVAKYIAGRHIPPASITSLFSISLNDFDQSNWSSWQLLLCRMLKAFPLSLSSDKLLANCCWEFCALWNSQSESIELLELSVAYLQDISNAVLQHGLATLLWSTFLNGKFQNCTFLVEKVGKYPKDRLCRKDVGVTEDGLLRFVVCCDQLLKTLLAANADYELATPTLVRYEDFLDDIFTDLSSTTTNRQSLIELANLQKCTNYHLVKHHCHLSTVLRLSLEHNLKPNKPMSLFDVKGRNAFHKSLYSHPLLPMADVDTGVIVARREFFSRLIDKVVDSLSFSAADYDQMQLADKSVVSHMAVTIKYMLELAKDWAVEQDSILRHQICCLYLHGYDRLAESILPQVENKILLGCELLQVVGQRLNYTVENGPPDFSCVISPTVSTWLKSCDIGELKSFDFSTDSLKTLLQHIDGVLTSSHAEHFIAEQLRELVTRLETC